MQLAEAAGAQALTDLTSPETAQKPAQTPAQTSADPEAPAKPPHHRGTDPGLLFVRLSRAIRQTIALEARLAAGAFAAPRRSFALADPRRTLIQRILHDATADHPDRTELRRDINERLDYELAEDLDANTPIAEIFQSICNNLGIHPDLTRLPDEFLPLPPPPNAAGHPALPAWLPHGAGPPHPNP